MKAGFGFRFAADLRGAFFAAFFAGAFFAAAFFAGPLRAEAFFAADFRAGPLAADFFEADFLAGDFFAAGRFAAFFAADFLEEPDFFIAMEVSLAGSGEGCGAVHLTVAQQNDDVSRSTQQKKSLDPPL
jgi:hypothetical protein